jgi:3-hydroxy-4-methylanthranilate adenylyltransferase
VSSGETATLNWCRSLLAAGADDAIALRFDRAVTYRELRAQVDGWRARLEAAGAGPDGRVLVQVAPSFSAVYALLATWSLGAQVALLDHRLKEAERERYADRLRPSLTVTSSAERISTFRAERELTIARGAHAPAPRTPHALLQFTSGSTGAPKIVGRGAQALSAELDGFAAAPGWPRAGDTVLVLNSLSHSFGLIGGLLSALRAGATAAFAASPLPRDLVAALEAARPTAVFGVPAHFELLGSVAAPALAGVRLAVNSGQLMPAAVREAFLRAHGVAIGDAYGSTEVGIIALDPTGELAPAVGRIVPPLDVRVRDEEVVVRLDASPYVAGDDDERYHDGWLRTGDRGALDEATGVLSVRGRRDSLAVVGGLKIDLSEVESVLRRAPGVSEAIVLFGDAIEAYVEADRADVDGVKLVSWCRGELADFKVPRRFFVLDRLPRSTTGKLIRRRDELERLSRATAPAGAAG